MLTPKGRGDLSEALFQGLRTSPSSWHDVLPPDPTDRDDAQISLWVLYELHYGGFEDVVDDLEWHPGLIGLRGSLERTFEAELRSRFTPVAMPDPFAESFFTFVEQHDGPSLAAYVKREATVEQVLDLLQCRSIYHLKEADPSTWTAPRLAAGPKAALMELQYDEFGCGDPQRMHSHLFAVALEACGLRSEYGAYIDDVPVEVLEQNNAMSLFGLHRRLRGASMGHLAAFEATSSVPSRRLSQGLSRLGLAPELIGYYDEHVEADSVHEQLAVRSICGELVAADPTLSFDVLFGAFTCLDLEDRVAHRLLGEWAS